MKLFEIDKAILNCIDEETGEIINEEKLTELQLAREKKLEGVALWIKNLAADAEALKKEKEVFAQREKTAKNKIASLKDWLTFATEGQNFETSKCKISFRKSQSVEILDEDGFIRCVQDDNRDDLLTYKSPTPNKTAIKEAIKDGEDVPFCALVEKENIQIK